VVKYGNSFFHGTKGTSMTSIKHCKLWLSLMMVCACGVLAIIATLSTIRLHDGTTIERMAQDQSGLYTIMALQYFSYRYGLPAEFSVRYSQTNNHMTVHIYTKEKALGSASLKPTFSIVNPDFVFSNCVREEHPIPCEIVSLALLWGCEKQGSAFLKDGFNVHVTVCPDMFIINVASHTLDMNGCYTVTIETARNIIRGVPGY
jgi:hypothetical protein